MQETAMKQQYTGPDTHVSTDQTVNQGYVNAHPTGEKAEYPKYLFHKDGGGKIVQDKDEHDQVGDDYSVDPPTKEESFVPAGNDEGELEDMSRSELAEYGNTNYGLQLKGSQSKAELLEAVRSAAARKAEGTLDIVPSGETQTLEDLVDESNGEMPKEGE
jgi:hypothetical protein